MCNVYFLATLSDKDFDEMEILLSESIRVLCSSRKSRGHVVGIRIYSWEINVAQSSITYYSIPKVWQEDRNQIVILSSFTAPLCHVAYYVFINLFWLPSALLVQLKKVSVF